jgi:ketosteroid isomerase-like protein
MSEENVEIVRRFFAAVGRFFDAYWDSPGRSLTSALETGETWPQLREALSYLHPDVEWQTVFLGDTTHGQLEMAKTWDDYLKWADDYRVGLAEAEDLGGDRVYGVVALSSKLKDSGARMDARFYDVLTIQGGLIVRIEEYTEPSQALEAAGPREG